MPRYAVLVRGVNVGGKNRLPMADFRALLAGLGFSAVATHLQSGNAVLTAEQADPAAVADAIEAGLRGLGFPVRCLVRARSEWEAVIAANPLTGLATDGSRLLVHFLSSAPDAAVAAAHDPLALDPQRIRLGERAIYQWCPDGVLAAPTVGPFVERHWGVVATTRNWNTVTRLAALLAG